MVRLKRLNKRKVVIVPPSDPHLVPLGTAAWRELEDKHRGIEKLRTSFTDGGAGSRWWREQ